MIDQLANNELVALDKKIRNIHSRIQIQKSNGITVYLYDENITSIKIERVGEDGKLSGFGVCQKATVKFIPNGVLKLTPQDKFHIDFCATKINGDYRSPAPWFQVYSPEIDQVTGEITVVGYDKLYEASKLILADLKLTSGYTVYSLTQEIMKKLGLSGNPKFINHNDPNFYLKYEAGANFSKDKTETLREVLDDIAEITQTIYYLDEKDVLCFKRLYGWAINFPYGQRTWSCEVGKRHVIKRIVSVTELGDNISAEVQNKFTGIEDTIYIRDNPFITLRDDAGTILTNCANAMKNIYADEVKIEWDGYYPLEIGDMIDLMEMPNNTYAALTLTNDIIEVNPGYQQTTTWMEKQDNAETSANPATLGEKLSQTYARVDKANQKIELAVKDIEGNKEAISGITIKQGEIDQTVSDLNGKYNKITHTLDGVVYDNGSGTTIINGSNITTGTISGDRINLNGAITWDDCDSDLQTTISNSNVPDYITATKITKTTIESPTIVGSEIKATGSFTVLSPSGKETGYMGYGEGHDAQGNTTTGVGVGTMDGRNYVIATDSGVRLTVGGGTNLQQSLFITTDGVYIMSAGQDPIKLPGDGGGSGTINVVPVWGE